MFFFNSILINKLIPHKTVEEPKELGCTNTAPLTQTPNSKQKTHQIQS